MVVGGDKDTRQDKCALLYPAVTVAPLTTLSHKFRKHSPLLGILTLPFAT